ncbi:MAG: phage tail assembly protein [Chloroflexales bacterium]|nr:phage tail assembly protein [Chloroflexales bacterium]
MFQTEYPFTLPRGYVDGAGNLHREGVMRLATAADEIVPLKDPRVQVNLSYLVIILLSRVVIRLGTLEGVNPKVIEGLFATDLSYLQGLYNRLNADESGPGTVVCPHCERTFALGHDDPGESLATPSASSARR